MSGTQTHTPGPWEVRTCPNGGHYEGGESPFTIGAGTDKFIAEIKRQSGRTEANAHLIAAAPEILSVCNAGVHDVQRVLDNWASGDLAAAVNGLEAWQETARAAIAKAEGGAS